MSISIIVPVYNVEQYLETCINSILQQSYREIEIILVDDGSTDSSGTLCDQLAKTDARIKVIHKKNGGLSDTRNAGLEVATGEYIGFVDSDDCVFPDMYERLLTLLNTYHADIAICDKIEFYEGETPEFTKIASSIKVFNQEQAIDALADDVGLRSHVWNRLYSASLFNNLRFDVGKAYEDVYIMHRLFLRARKVVVTNEPMYCYLQRDSSILGTLNLKKRMDLFWGYARRYEETIVRYPDAAKKTVIPMYYCMWDIIKHSNLKNKAEIKKIIAFYKKNVGIFLGIRDRLLCISPVACILLFSEKEISHAVK